MEESVLAVVDEIVQHESGLVNLSEIRAHDDYLLSHSLDVCVLAVITAVNLGWNKEMVTQVGLAGLLHDVGKVRVPPAILMKPGPLNQEEWEEVRKHPLHALEILDESPCIMNAASQHHENRDGTGYPLGLTGDAIVACARIIAIADLYDAMTTDRVYRRAVPVNEAVELIYASGGGRFDIPFVRSIAAYRVGDVVELSDGSIGVVSGNFPGLPLYPRVRLLQEPGGEPVPPKDELSLGEHNLTVVRLLTAAESFALSRRWGQVAGGGNP